MRHSGARAMRQHEARSCSRRRLQKAGDAQGVIECYSDRFRFRRRHAFAGDDESDDAVEPCGAGIGRGSGTRHDIRPAEPRREFRAGHPKLGHLPVSYNFFVASGQARVRSHEQLEIAQDHLTPESIGRSVARRASRLDRVGAQFTFTLAQTLTSKQA